MTKTSIKSIFRIDFANLYHPYFETDGKTLTKLYDYPDVK